MMNNNKQKVAIVHYWLDDYRGGEKVIEAFCEMFPDADIYTHIYKPEKLPNTITSHKVFTTFISKLPFAKTYYRHYLLLMPLALKMLNLKKYDLIISSESGPAKGIRKRKNAKHICYCHSPMRYIWDMEREYLDSLKLKVNSEKKKNTSGSLYSIHRLYSMIYAQLLCFFWRIIACYLRGWDRKSAQNVDIFIANSKFIAARIRKFYSRKAVVINPPVEIGKFRSDRKREEFYLCVSQLVSYKKVSLVVEAFNILNLPLTVIGNGPEMDRIKSTANDNVKILGRVSDKVLQEKMETCKAFVFAGKEDFGLIFPEAHSAGAPVIAYGKGGAKEIIENNKTGILFNKQTVDAIVEAVQLFNVGNANLLSSVEIADIAKKYNKCDFKKSMINLLEKESCI